MSAEESAISRAVHADAEAARAQIRAAGIICPSCGTNMADLPELHALRVNGQAETAQCDDGEVAAIDGSDVLRAAINVEIYDDYRARMRAHEAEIFG